MTDYLIKNKGAYCGYCNSEDGFIACGIFVFSISIHDYELLINKGWRRSGNYLYKPIASKTCCPMYPIRCNVSTFKLSKSQRKILKKINRDFPKICLKMVKEGPKGDDDSQDLDYFEMNNLLDFYRNKKPVRGLSKSLNNISEIDKSLLLKKSNSEIRLIAINKYSNCDSDSLDIKRILNVSESLSSALKYQMMIMSENCDELNSLLSINNIKIYVVPNILLLFNKDRLQEEFNLYEKYQIAVHKDLKEDLTMKQFQEFLVISPLKVGSILSGSFHLQFRLETKLIGVSVIDILPQCVSSVYFFYDPEFSKYSLGVYSILCEINLVGQLNKRHHRQSMNFHYSGFYIDSCAKMNYKANYRPCELCCPSTHMWFDFNQCLPLIKADSACSSFYQLHMTKNIADFIKF